MTHLKTDNYIEYLKDVGINNISDIPRTPEEIKQAKERLKKLNYQCSICKDGRFVHPVVDGMPDYSRVVPCQCVKDEIEKKIKDRLLEYCEIPDEGKHMTFDNFKQSEPLNEAYQACLSLASEKDTGWITLMGDSGRGKTHLGMAVIHEWLRRGKPAKYVYVPILLKELKDGFSKDADGSYSDRYDTFLNVPLLFMDDLGTENSTPWAQEHLDTIVDYRLMRKLPLIITTNTPKNKLPFRIASRLERGGQIIFINALKFKF